MWWSLGGERLVVVAAVNTVASLYYYLRWVARATGSGAAVARAPGSHPSAAAAAALLAATATVLVGLFAGPLLDQVSGTLVR